MSTRFLVYGGLWAMAGRLSANVTLVASQALVARLLPNKGEMGLFLLAYSLATTFVCVAQGGFNTAGMRFIAERLAGDEPDRSSVRVLVRRLVALFTTTSIGGALLITWGGGTWFVEDVLDKPALAGILFWIAGWVIVLVQERSMGDLLRGFKDIRGAALLHGGFSGALLCLVLISMMLVGWKASLAEVLAAAIASTGAAAIVGIVAIRRNLETLLPASAAISTETEHVSVRDIASPALTMMLINTFAYLFSQVDLWILGIVSGNEAVALYGIPQRLVMLIQVPMAIVNSFLPPLLAESHAKGDLFRREPEIRLVATVASIPSLAVLILFWTANGPILEAIYPGYGGSGFILAVLAVAQAVFVLVGPIGFTLLMTGHHLLVLGTTVTILVCHVVVGAIVAHAYGPNGLAVASTVAGSVYFLALLMAGRRRLGIWTAADPHQLRELRKLPRHLRRVLLRGADDDT